MLVATMQTDLIREHQCYPRGRKQVTTVTEHNFGPTETVDWLFKSLLQHCSKSQSQYHPQQKDWISQNLALIGAKSGVGGRLNQTVQAKRQQLKNRIRTSLNRDHQQHASIA
jgi:hypothetical protein